MSSRISSSFAALSLVLAATFSPGLAANAVIDITGCCVTQGVAEGRTVGWAFTTSAALTVNALGWWVYPTFDIVSSHQAGLWTEGGTLLGSATITAGPANDGVWRFTDTAPIALASGATYVIGGYDTEADGDSYRLENDSVTLAPELTFMGTAISAPGMGFAFPDTVYAFDNGRFGPNFRFDVAAAPGVPEPASWALLILGFGMIGAARRRRTTLAYGACRA